MNFVKKLQNKARGQRSEVRGQNVMATGLLMAGLVLAIGCAPTVRPVVLHATTASWDGNKQDSGLLGLDAQKNAILTAHAKDRYNVLMDAYGSRFSPPAKAGDGITGTATNTFLLDAQHFVYFTVAERILKREQQH